jgi:tetratricopeptide (TPR) repeat protein
MPSQSTDKSPHRDEYRSGVCSSRTDSKQATLLFATISIPGSDRARHGAAVEQLSAAALALIDGEVQRRGGTVDRHLPNGLLALFGAPLADEEHARRAVQAALGIQRAIERLPEVGVLQSLHSLDLVIHFGDDDFEMDPQITPHVMWDLASLQQVARPGRVVISDSCKRRTAGYFRTQPIHAPRDGGSVCAEVLPAWEVTGARAVHTRLERDVEPGLTLRETSVPDTVQDVLAARIDRLQDSARETLQLAALIGREFSAPTLEALVEAPRRAAVDLATLVDLGLLETVASFPRGYAFKHALTHELAYNSLPPERRTELHRRVGLVLELGYGPRCHDQCEVLADHFSRGQDWQRALGYLRQAGVNAEARAANQEAARYFELALTALARLPSTKQRLEQAVDVRFDLRRALSQLGDAERSLANLKEAGALADRLGDPLRSGWVAAHLGGHAWFTGTDPDTALALVQRAWDIGNARADSALSGHAALRVGWAYHARGEYQRAIQWFRRTANLARGPLLGERFGHVGLPSVMAQSYLSSSHAELGMFSTALAHGKQAIRLAERLDHSFSRVICGIGLAVTVLAFGDAEQAAAILEEGYTLSQTTSMAAGDVFIAPILGWAWIRAGRTQEAVRLLEHAVESTSERKLLLHHPLRLVALGEAYLASGRFDEARAQAELALNRARSQVERAHEVRALCLLGDLEVHATRRPSQASAKAYYRDAVLLAEQLELRPLLERARNGFQACDAPITDQPTQSVPSVTRKPAWISSMSCFAIRPRIAIAAWMGSIATAG